MCILFPIFFYFQILVVSLIFYSVTSRTGYGSNVMYEKKGNLDKDNKEHRS